MNEGTPEQPIAAEQQETSPLLETAQAFTADESEGFSEAIDSRASEEASRPGLLKRLATSAKARMAMTIVAGATAVMLGGPSAEAGERKQNQGSGATGRAIITGLLRAAQGKAYGERTGEAVRRGVSEAMEQRAREREAQQRFEAAQEQRRAERANTEAHQAEGAMRDAEYKLRQIEGELPRIEREVKVAQYEVLKLAATDPEAKEVRRIMNARTALKIDLWKASYDEDENRVRELSGRDAALEEELLPHLGSKVAQKAGDIFVNTIMPGELKMLDLEGQQGYLKDAMTSAGREMRDAMRRYEGHAERAQRAYELATLGGRGGYGRY